MQRNVQDSYVFPYKRKLVLSTEMKGRDHVFRSLLSDHYEELPHVQSDSPDALPHSFRLATEWELAACGIGLAVTHDGIRFRDEAHSQLTHEVRLHHVVSLAGCLVATIAPATIACLSHRYEAV